MRVRVTRVRSRSSRGWRWAEAFFLIAGLTALDYYIWVNANSALYQTYENWRFDQELAGRTASIPKFLAAEIGWNTARPDPAIERKSADEHSGLDRFVPDAGLQKTEKPGLIGRIDVPRLNLTAIVREGVDSKTLRRAVGHIPSTALPGMPGNVGMAGHRDTFFRNLRDIKKEDRITVETLRGNYEYVVDSIQIVRPGDVSVLKAAAKPSLTLVTCYPFNYVGSAPSRFIVRARQVASVPAPQMRAGF
jgi:LPXTG-site transpeptidase (sortase) family protein